MEYSICHGLWLYRKYVIHMLGFICCMAIKSCSALGGDMNYIHWVLIFGNGGQGGEFNVLGKVWVSSLGLGLAQWFGSFAKWIHELCI